MQVGWVKIGDFRQIAGYISTRSSAIAAGSARRAVSVKIVLNVAQMFVELHLISPALGE